MNKRKPPERRCVACREMKTKFELIRIVKTKEGEILVDPTGKANGRGAYLCKKLECLEKAQKSGALQRSLKTNISEETFEQLEKFMEEE